jgi:rare lipoprotein A
LKLIIWHFIGTLAILAFCVGAVVYSIPARAAQCGGGDLVVASFYGTESGSRTANGEPFNGTSLTAASRSLPFNTRVRITMLDPRKEMRRWYGKSVEVRINDRGPYVKGRAIDLSRAAAALIGLTQSGVSKVCLERLST